MKLTKRSDKVSKDENQLGISRRSFIRNSSLAAAGGVAGASLFAPSFMRKAEAFPEADYSAPKVVKRTICSHWFCGLWHLC